MRPPIRRVALLRLIPAFAAAALLLAPVAAADAGTPFDTLLGSWRGSGQIELDQGRRERLKCNAYYTGGGSQLRMAILCQSESSNVQIRSALSESGGRISGTWEERTYNAQGNASGQVSNGKLSLSISGGVTGTMIVTFTSSRQSVAITTQGVALKSVSIDLARS
ncbi:MAG: hypothetical protein ACRECI_14490 [Methyloceanibacter sp.]